MNLEFDVKEVIREDRSPEKRANEICEISSFKKEDIISAILEGGETASDIYRNLIKLTKNEK